MIEFTLNGTPVQTDDDPEMPLLWYVRDRQRLTGSKFGCGAGLCGACTMHVNGEATRTCILPLEAVAGAEVRTIENLALTEGPNAVQRAWVAEQVPQCGYCQSGMIMAVTALLEENPDPSDADIDATITNICRCGTYTRIRKAIHRAAKELRDSKSLVNQAEEA